MHKRDGQRRLDHGQDPRDPPLFGPGFGVTAVAREHYSIG